MSSQFFANANNEVDNQYAYVLQILTPSSSEMNLNCRSENVQTFGELTHQEYNQFDYYSDPKYNAQSQQGCEDIEQANPRVQLHQQKSQNIEEQKVKPLQKETAFYEDRLHCIISQTQNTKPLLNKQQNSQIDQSSNKYKSKKIKKNKKEQYPTKNFLPSFRSSVLNYLARYFKGEYFENIEVIKRVRGKKCINMTDYQDIFNYPQFRPCLEKYFQNKVINHDLMTSRIDNKLKALYFTKIHVFQDAFRNGVFSRIN